MNISSFKIMATHSTTLSRKNRSIITLHPFINAVLGDIWKFTLEKNLKCKHCDYASAHASDLIDIWKLTLGLNPTNATNMNLHLFRKTIWGDIWKFTLEKNRANANFASNLNFSLKRHLRTHSGIASYILSYDFKPWGFASIQRGKNT